MDDLCLTGPERELIEVHVIESEHLRPSTKKNIVFQTSQVNLVGWYVCYSFLRVKSQESNLW